MKNEGILISYKPRDFQSKAHAWGKKEWLDSSGEPIEKYKALKPKEEWI